MLCICLDKEFVHFECECVCIYKYALADQLWIEGVATNLHGWQAANEYKVLYIASKGFIICYIFFGNGNQSPLESKHDMALVILVTLTGSLAQNSQGRFKYWKVEPTTGIHLNPP